jgi:hypothetical protein
VRVHDDVAREVAASYLAASCHPDARTVAAFTQLGTETDRVFRWLTLPERPGALRVHFTKCDAPYRDAEELIASVAQTQTLEIATVAAQRDRRHPLLGNEYGGGYDRFRAVHDALGHARMRLGFDRNEEFTVWRAQERLHSPLARAALATELHGQHSVRWTTGEFGAPKAMLIDSTLLRRARRGRA